MPIQDNDAVKSHTKDPDDAMGAVAQDRPGQPNNTADFTQQIDHRDQRTIKKDSDTDFPEPGNNPEYSMQKQDDSKKQSDPVNRKETDDLRAEDEVNQDPGERQKENQNEKKDDDLAA